jgi:peptidoglycan/xylan/chitin deacetylase (PgdA/CDA1 family)
MDKERLAANPAVVRAALTATRSRLVVLAYHGVDDPDLFAEQLGWLRLHRRPISLDDLAATVRDGRPLREPSFLVTFDDGRRSVLSQGAPVLEALDIPAVLFVVAGLVGTSVPYWWDEVEELSAAGATTSVDPRSGHQLTVALKEVPDQDRRTAIDELRATSPVTATPYPHLGPAELVDLESRGIAIGSHSLTHPCLDRCSTDEVISELSDSRRRLEDWLGHPVRSMAYPNGNVDDRVAGAAATAGYDLGFVFDHRLTHLPPPDPLRISRLRVDTTDSLERFKGIVSGVSPLVLGIRGRR